MKLVTTLCRIVLGFVFLAFGLNGFLHFIPNMPMPAPAIAFFAGLASTHAVEVLFATQALSGALLILGLWVPLALTLLAPIIVNIVLFHVFLAPAGLPVAIIVALLEVFLVYAYREAFAPILSPRYTPAA